MDQLAPHELQAAKGMAERRQRALELKMEGREEEAEQELQAVKALEGRRVAPCSVAVCPAAHSATPSLNVSPQELQNAIADCRRQALDLKMEGREEEAVRELQTAQALRAQLAAPTTTTTDQGADGAHPSATPLDLQAELAECRRRALELKMEGREEEATRQLQAAQVLQAQLAVPSLLRAVAAPSATPHKMRITEGEGGAGT